MLPAQGFDSDHKLLISARAALPLERALPQSAGNGGRALHPQKGARWPKNPFELCAHSLRVHAG